MSIFNDAISLEGVPIEQYKNYIGPGYRSVSYSVDENRNGQITFLGYDTVGNRKAFICPHNSYIKYNVKYETDEKDIFDNYVATKIFKNAFERKKYLENVSIPIIECLKPEQEFLHKLFDANVLDDNFNKQPLRIQYIDIETEISDQFMKPSVAGNRINMITIYDSETEKFYTWSLDHADIKFDEEPLCNYPKDKFVFFEFHNDEIALLENFVSWIEDNYPDVSFGWNIKAYDWPYIVRRIEEVLGPAEAKRLSPVNKYFIKKVNHDNERADVAAEIEVDIAGLFIADGLILYRDKFNVPNGSLDGGYNLDNVGEHEGCGHKIKYDGTLKDLYLQDYQKFYEYNVRDVDLAKRIDDKCKMISLARQITSYGLTGYGAIYSSISYLIGSVLSFARTKMGGKVFTSYLAKKKEFDSFEGAFVFPTVAGVYRGGIGTIDFASLYPSNIRSINASPETYIGKVVVYRKDDTGHITINKCGKTELRFDPFKEDATIVNENDATQTIISGKDPSICKIDIIKPNGEPMQFTSNGKQIDLSVDLLKALIGKKYIYTTNNTLFLKHEIKWGVIAKWCEYFYGLRKSTKKKMLACDHRLNVEADTLSEEEKTRLQMESENYNTAQLGIKSMINSIYGCMGTTFSPIANPDIAQSITRQGRFCNQSTGKFILKKFMEKYGAPEDYVVDISGDTDSQFINLQCMSDWMRKEKNLPEHLSDWPKKNKRELWDLVSKFVNEEVNPFVRKLVHDYCHTTQQDVLTYELEYMGDVGIYESKKHYAVHKIFNEGDEADYVKYSGIELKKAQVPKEMKTFLAEIYDGVISKNWIEKDYKNYINNLYDRFNQFSIDEISFWKGYNTERQSVGFLQMQTGTTGIAKACTYYNQILKKLGIGHKYEEIRVGDKVRFCYIEPNNKFNINCIAYKPGQYPKEFAQLFKPDYYVMFNKIILDPLKRFRIACKFKESDPSDQMVQDIFEL